MTATATLSPLENVVDPAELPRLLYFADVTVENFMHGSALMYRLLETYPADKLLIVEGPGKSRPDRRLPGVTYRATYNLFHSLLTSRFGPRLSNIYALAGGDGVRALDRVSRDFKPEAVLTVAHGYQWQGAASFCREKSLPLHLVAHDRWQDSFSASAAVKKRIAPIFARAYRQAVSRFCVSRPMVEAYELETGAPGTVLYPARRWHFSSFSTVSPRVAQTGQPFTVAYAGSISDQGLMDALVLTLGVLKDLGGQLLVFGPYSAENMADRGLIGENLVVGGSIPPHELAGRLRSDADVLIASVSFDPRLADAMEMCFPSKLTDYTAAGLPILAHGPATSSAVRWARENPGVAAVVDTMNPGDLKSGLSRLRDDSNWRYDLAQMALKIGDRQFSGNSAERTLFAALAR